MREVQLTRGFIALVDDMDFDWLSQWKWRVSGSGYAERNDYGRGPGTKRLLKMHNAIMQPPPGMVVDHWNGDPMDNQRNNLRVVTRQENAANLGHARMVFGRWVPIVATGKLLGITGYTAQCLIWEGLLPATNFGSRWLVWRRDIDAYLEYHGPEYGSILANYVRERLALSNALGDTPANRDSFSDPAHLDIIASIEAGHSELLPKPYEHLIKPFSGRPATSAPQL